MKEHLQNVSYDKRTDMYEVYDCYGGTSLVPKEVTLLLKLVQKTHPELLEPFRG
jgi:hypothetical protein